MKEEIKYLEKIERYVNDQLTEAEKEDFEKKLAADKKLADEVEWYKAAKNLVIHAGRNELKNKFAAFEKELSPS
ncbi:MAG TPA: hypothetical protein ENJ20_04780, partial [Bacteroidetes bacterium]|nr:hypothetical protein [Bacteroidota bacterium]